MIKSSRDEWDEQWNLFRSLAVTSMVMVHSVAWSISRADFLAHRVNGLNLSYLFLVGLPALLLPAAAGRSLRKVARELDSGLRITKPTFLKMGAYAWLLMLAGLTLNVTTWGIEALWTWDALPFLSISTLCLGGILYGLGKRAVPVLTVLLLPAAALGKTWGLPILFGGVNPTVNWPLFPWISLLFWGFILEDRRFSRATLTLIGIGLLVAGLYFGGLLSLLPDYDAWETNPFRLGSSLAICVAGGLTLGLGIAVLPVSLSPWTVPLSRGCFWIYLFHVIVGYPVVTWAAPQLVLSVRLPLFMTLMPAICWLVGALAVWLAEKRVRLVVRRTRPEMTNT